MNGPLLPPVQVSICTFRRPDELRAALEEITKQILEIGADAVRVLVVDNDADGSARAVAASHAESRGLKGRISYVVEPRGGVGYARNRAMDFVGDGEWLIFFDDDQIPEHGWLECLLNSVASGAEGLWSGPVLPASETSWPRWGKGGWAWGIERARASDDFERASCGFGNVLISPAVIADQDSRVPDFFRSGPGEDTVVSMKLAAKGWAIRNLPAARATEHLGPERLRMNWVIRRYFFYGRTTARSQRYVHGESKQIRNTLAAGRAFVRALVMFTTALAGREKRHVLFASAAAELCRGTGLLAGNFGQLK